MVSEILQSQNNRSLSWKGQENDWFLMSFSQQTKNASEFTKNFENRTVS